jgi:hypothetical protein
LKIIAWWRQAFSCWVFAITFSIAFTGSNHEVMIATADYVAVLVVFVGQMNPSIISGIATLDLILTCCFTLWILVEVVSSIDSKVHQLAI